jgi:hypothetical protein
MPRKDRLGVFLICVGAVIVAVALVVLILAAVGLVTVETSAAPR